MLIIIIRVFTVEAVQQSASEVIIPADILFDTYIQLKCETWYVIQRSTLTSPKTKFLNVSDYG